MINDAACSNGTGLSYKAHSAVQRYQMFWKALAAYGSVGRLINSSDLVFMYMLYCYQGFELGSLYGTAQ